MSNQTVIAEPEGISFFSIRTGETHFCKLEPTIAAYINSSDIGINASRGQDYGWRLSPEWVKKVRDFRRDSTQMSILTAKNGGQKPTLTQILYYMYGEQLQRYFESQEENENPFEEQYAQMIASGKVAKGEALDKPAVPAALADFLDAQDEDDEEDDMSDLIDEVITEDEETAPALTPEQQKAADDAELARMEAEEKANKAKADKKPKA
jgi:hypothetical protein